jgi:hypothetical protein
VVKLSISDVVLAPTLYKGAFVYCLSTMFFAGIFTILHIVSAVLLKVWGSNPRIDPFFSR